MICSNDQRYCSGTLAIAKVKAEMHRALEEKDAELQVARARCKSLELSGSYFSFNRLKN